LHVAAYSILASYKSTGDALHFHIFSDSLICQDITLLETTLRGTGNPFVLQLHKMQTDAFADFPAMLGSLAIYYRLVVPELVSFDRFIYVDVDTVCDVDLGELDKQDIGKAPAALVPEAPLAQAVDRKVAEQLGNSPDEPYFNAGIILVNVAEWRRQKIARQTLDYIAVHRPAFHDQAALNYVLYRKAFPLDARFNCIANIRKNWAVLSQPWGKIGRLVHFLDQPKPWDWMCEFIHPQYRLWRSVLDKTAMKHFRSWHAIPSGKFFRNKQTRIGYQKALKDRLLFAGYSRGWFRRVKGVPQI